MRYYHSTTFHKNIVYDNLHLSYIIEHISCHKCCDIDQQNENIGAFCLRMRENHSVRLQMADVLGGGEFCHGFYEKSGADPGFFVR